MGKDNSSNNILYVNRYTNVCYKENEILELNIQKDKDELIKDAIFNLYCRLLTRSGEQRLVFYYLTYYNDEYSIAKLIRVLSNKYGKSERTYRRAIDNMMNRRVLYVKNNILFINMDYNLSILDLDNIKSIMVHVI